MLFGQWLLRFHIVPLLTSALGIPVLISTERKISFDFIQQEGEELL